MIVFRCNELIMVLPRIRSYRLRNFRRGLFHQKVIICKS